MSDPITDMVFDMPSEVYHARPEISKSDLDLFARSPAHYKAKRNKPTDAMKFGSGFHCLVLEPDSFKFNYAVAPKCDKRTKEGKAEFVSFQESVGDRVIVSHEDAESMNGIAASVREHAAAKEYFNDACAFEVSFFNHLQGIHVRCRADIITDRHWIVDVKTTEDASAFAFAKTALNYRYHVQNAYYRDIVSKIGGIEYGFAFIAIEKTPPYAVAVYELDAEAIELGRATYQKQLSQLAECQKFNHWPAYSSRLQSLSLPPWAFT